MKGPTDRLMGGPRVAGPVVPTASQSVVIEADHRVPGVRLVAAGEDATGAASGTAGGPDDPAEERALLHQFSPDFIVFPDATDKAAPPFKDGLNDYHPRPVEAFLDGAQPYVATPGGVLAGIYVGAIVTLVTGFGAFLLVLAAGQLRLAQAIAPLLAGGAVVGLALWLVLLSAAPRNTDRLREKVARGEGTSRLGIRRSLVDLPDTLWALQAWTDYRRRIVDSAKYPRTTYGRAVPAANGDRFLQYWQFYVFNDWHNRHEADWELVVVRVAPTADGGWSPRAAAYSSHFGGHWRTWEDLESRDETHPVVYVARGSHAQYFESRADGYRASLTQPLELLEFRIRLIVQNDWTDVVAAATGTEEQPYQLVVIPADLEVGTVTQPTTSQWTEAELEAWWWLRFRGLWGAREAIPGPASQELKWTDPRAWVRLFVDRDVGDLDEFATGEGPVT